MTISDRKLQVTDNNTGTEDNGGCEIGTGVDALDVATRNGESNYTAITTVNLLPGFESNSGDDYAAYVDNSLTTCVPLTPPTVPAQGWYYAADVVGANDYYPFGMLMPGRKFSSGSYRYGFNGKENDNDVKGEGNQQDYGMRIYDPRLGKFLSLDPLTKDYPWYTPYQFAGNKPIWAIDLDGAEEAYRNVGNCQKQQSLLRAESERSTAWKNQGVIKSVSPTFGEKVSNFFNKSGGQIFFTVGPGSDLKNIFNIADDIKVVTTSFASSGKDSRHIGGDKATFDQRMGSFISVSTIVIGSGLKPELKIVPEVETRKLLPNSSSGSKVAVAQEKLANAANGSQGNGIFIVSERGTTVSTSQSRMIESFNNAGFPTFPTESPGIGYVLPNGMRVRAMLSSGPAPLRISLENKNSQPVNIDGKTINPPRGTIDTRDYIRKRAHVTQTQ